MAIKLLKMNIMIFKNSGSYDDFISFYIFYLSLIIMSLLSGIGIMLLIFTTMLGCFLSIFFNVTQSAYIPPMTFNSYTNNSMILENSLPTGRRNFIKGRILFNLSTTFLSLIMLTPSIIALFIIGYKTKLALNTALILKITLGIALFMIWGILFGTLYQITHIKSSQIRRKIDRFSLWILVGFIILRPFIQDYVPKFNLPNFSPKQVIGIISLILILLLVQQIIGVIRKINKIDFHN